MRQTPKLPTHGQFVAVWVDNGEIWSATLTRNESGDLMYFTESEDGALTLSESLHNISGVLKNAIFFVKG